MAIDKVKEYFGKYNMAERIQEFEVSSATVELAAATVPLSLPLKNWKNTPVLQNGSMYARAGKISCIRV